MKHLPLVARLPLIAALMIFIVAVGTTQLGMRGMLQQQETLIDRFGAVYLDGLSASVLPHVSAGSSVEIGRALERALQFHEGLRDRQLIVIGADGRLVAHAALPGALATEAPPRELEARDGAVLLDDGFAWFRRTLRIEGREIAMLYAELDMRDLLAGRQGLSIRLLVVDLLISALCAALGYVLMKRMLEPAARVAARLEAAERGEFQVVPESELSVPETEFGQLQRGFNRMITAIQEREEMAKKLAEQEKAAVLGRLAATMAHEVRNPLGGMTNALETIRRYGDDAQVRAKSLNLLGRGLETIADVVNSALATYREPAGGRPLSRADFDDLRALVEPEAQRRGIALAWDVDVPDSIPINATETRQIVLNLLLNACAASPQGGRVRFIAQARDTMLSVTVEDEGPGLPDEVALAFSGTGPDVAGSGMGVGVIVRLLQDLQGRMSVDSSPARGTRITLTLPLVTAET